MVRGRRLLRALDLPAPRHEAVDQHGGGDAQRGEENPRSVTARHEPLVRAGGDQVVVVGDEAHRCLDFGVRARRLGQVERLAPLLVAEAKEAGTKRLDRLP